jgi:hypothetical protein
MRTLFVSLLAATLAALAAYGSETYRITLFQASTVAGKTLAAGDYTLEIDGATAHFRGSRDQCDIKVRAESIATRSKSTLIRYEGAKYEIREVVPKGKQVRFVFEQ